MTERAQTRRDTDTLAEAWSNPSGLWGWLTIVNHKNVGRRFIVTGLIFFVLGGVMALLMRTQLAVPEATFLDADFYNQMFTMHGTTMMFLFAIPMLEGLMIYLMPLMIGTRDMPFPRLNAFGYLAYLFGGTLIFSSFIVGEVPREGWFAYVPLASDI
ncbi:MAG TPA: cbb3-type cytochrome c oxidase subunit I, partial [Acidimicrobiia bacterium]|nr:cbb3-type cytochrome c oxidase subunit I [Acidimicrobiia bacterium]